VTFIVGMKCADGLVLCADSLESDGVTKSYRTKLASFLWNDGLSSWGLCWGASGHAFVCDKFKDKMKQSFATQTYNRPAIEEKIEVCLQFIKQSYADRDGITVVIGLFGNPGPDKNNPLDLYLYRGSSDSACISPVREHCCAGMDVTLATFFLSNTYHPLMPVEHGKRLGVFTTPL
jgi:20S proteasome alpha/beta subunit